MFALRWELRERLAPLLFDEDDPAGAAAERASIVAPAKRSPSAQRKANTCETEEGLPVHSFRGLLSQLGTLCKNEVSAELPEEITFQQYTCTTPLQRRAFDLLDVRVNL